MTSTFARPRLLIGSPQDNGGISRLYAWDIACSDCLTFIGRHEYREPRYIDGDWRPAAIYVRTLLAPQLSQLDGLDAETGLPRFGLRAKARTSDRPPSRRTFSPGAWHDVVGPVVAYCPRRGCERKHLLEPPSQYGPTPHGDDWPGWVNPVTGEDLVATGSLDLAYVHATKLDDSHRAGPRGASRRSS